MTIDLSIIIVTYNGLDITLKTLSSYRKALAADQNYRYEIIVVDNASQDGVVNSIIEKYSEVNLIKNSENSGFSKANNIGFRVSKGRNILFSNPDIELTEKTLPTLIELMDQNPFVGACTPLLKLVKAGEIDWGAHRGFPTPWASFTYLLGLSQVFKRSKRLSKVFGKYHLLDRDLTKEHEVDVIRGGFFFVKRNIFEKAGMWDEDYFMFGEDIDLCYQIKALGYKVMFYPQALAFHYHGMTTGLKKHSQDLSLVDHKVKEKVYNAFYDAMKIFYIKNYKTKYHWVIGWLILLTIDIKKKLGMRNKII